MRDRPKGSSGAMCHSRPRKSVDRDRLTSFVASFFPSKEKRGERRRRRIVRSSISRQCLFVVSIYSEISKVSLMCLKTSVDRFLSIEPAYLFAHFTYSCTIHPISDEHLRQWWWYRPISLSSLFYRLNCKDSWQSCDEKFNHRIERKHCISMGLLFIPETTSQGSRLNRALWSSRTEWRRHRSSSVVQKREKETKCQPMQQETDTFRSIVHLHRKKTGCSRANLIFSSININHFSFNDPSEMKDRCYINSTIDYIDWDITCK